MARVHGVVVLSLVVAGCFVDTGGGASATNAGESTSEPGVTSGGPGEGTCAGACVPGGTTTQAAMGTGEGTGGSTGEDAGETVTGAPGSMFVQGGTLSVPGAYAPVAVSFNGDSYEDLVVTSRDVMAPNLYVLLGPGFAEPMIVEGGASTAMETANFDGDGDGDLLLARPGAPADAHTFLWDGELKGGTQVALSDGCMAPREVGFSDFDADGQLDGVIACDQAGVIVLPGVGVGLFGAPVQIAVDGAAGAVAIADVIGTPFPDIVYADTVKNTVVVLPGTGTFEPDVQAMVVFPVMMPTAITIGQIDTDGTPDIAVSAAVGGCPVFLSMGGAPVVGEAYACGSDARDVHVPDLDGDGLPDIVTVHGDALHVGRGLGDGTFTGPEVYAAMPGSIQAAILDFDGDARRDIAVTSPDAVTLFLQVG